MKVEFDHRTLEPQREGLQVTINSTRVPEPLARQLAGRIRVTKWLVLFVGASAVAFATQRAGVTLSGALCIFAGALPALWVMGWLSGALLHMRRTARDLSTKVGSAQWQRELEAATRVERVTFEVLDTGLQVTRPALAPRLVGFQRVGMQRLLELLVVNVEGEAFRVPVGAFASGDDFDAFCLSLQASVWAAERAALP